MLAGLIGTTPIDVVRSDPGGGYSIIILHQLVSAHRLGISSIALLSPVAGVFASISIMVRAGRRPPFYAERWQRPPQHQNCGRLLSIPRRIFFWKGRRRRQKR